MKQLNKFILEKLILNKNISIVKSNTDKAFNNFLEDYNIKLSDQTDVTYSNNIIITHNKYICPSKLLNKMRNTFKNINRVFLVNQIKEVEYGNELVNDFVITKSRDININYFSISLARKWTNNNLISISMSPRQSETLVLKYDKNSKYPIFDLLMIFIKYLIETH